MERQEIVDKLIETLTDRVGAGSALWCAGKDPLDVVDDVWLRVDELDESHLDIDHLAAEVESMMEEYAAPYIERIDALELELQGDGKAL